MSRLFSYPSEAGVEGVSKNHTVNVMAIGDHSK
jgi:hypothetical protein